MERNSRNKPLIMTERPIITKARRLSKDKRIADILQVARVVLRNRGSDQFATAEVARLCGVSEGTIYKYFASRRDLLIKVAEEWFEEFVEDEHPEDRSLSVRERLMLGVRQHLSIIRAEPALTRFLLTDLRSDPQYRSLRIYQLNRQAAQRFSNIIADGVASGEFRGDADVRLVRNMILGCIEYSIWSFLRGEGDFAVESTAQAISDIILRGIAVRDGSSMGAGLVGEVTRLSALIDRLEARDAAQASTAGGSA